MVAASGLARPRSRGARSDRGCQCAGQDWARPHGRVGFQEIDQAQVAVVGGKVARAAEALGISRQLLYRLLDQYGLERDDR